MLCLTLCKLTALLGFKIRTSSFLDSGPYSSLLESQTRSSGRISRARMSREEGGAGVSGVLSWS